MPTDPSTLARRDLKFLLGLLEGVPPPDLSGKAVPLVALDGWTAEIAVDGAHLGDPLGGICVTWDKAMQVTANLQGDVAVGLKGQVKGDAPRGT